MDINKLIGHTQRPDPPTNGTGKMRVGNSDASQPKSATSASSEESLTLTETAKTLNAAMEGASDAPYDSARVKSIKEAIEDGRYQIDNQKVANSLLAFEASFA